MYNICKCCRDVVDATMLIKIDDIVKEQSEHTIKNKEAAQRPDVYKCKYCGLLQVFVEKDINYRENVTATVMSKENTEFRKEQFVDFVERYRLKRKTMIEIGAARGELLRIMDSSKEAVFGIEFNEAAVRRANDQGLNMLEGFVQDRDFFIPGAPYQSFYMINFLHKVPEPGELIRGIYNNVSKDAVGYIEVPNLEYILNNAMTEEFNRFHLSYFDMSSLVNILSINGFKVLKTGEVFEGAAIYAEVKKRLWK